ncbi:MAG TPA: 2-oxo-4-hydroxy-4-carboxy-5-ureidoimidazoline decarboxylase [Gaiellaceae bacterium]|nr:2-oxo-4-hydroxy-4-carboxy-5-ureidoimidazoline decarboxylase [Gaiellaceae bacterium]
MRELPRQLTADELAGLFSGRTRLVERLAAYEDPLGVARDVVHEASEDEKAEALAAHPRIGEHSPEQHGDDPCVLAELMALNRAYEQKFGFRFVVFVNGRSRAELLPVLRERLQRTRTEEVDTGCDDLVSIALDRWQKG